MLGRRYVRADAAFKCALPCLAAKLLPVGKPGHQYGCSLRLTLDTRQIDGFARSMVALAVNAEAHKSVNVICNETDIASTALQRVKYGLFG
jgi:hypothetical protein